MVPTMSKPNSTQFFSAIQLKKVWKKSEMSYLATLEREDMKISSHPPKDIQEVFEDYEDAMPLELLKNLPPKKEMDLQIELELGAKPFTKPPIVSHVSSQTWRT